jgi:ParB family chromosome partitioning protein
MEKIKSLTQLFTKEKPNEKIINNVIEIPIDNIIPNPYQPRTEFDTKELHSLADSILQNGLLQPITVRKKSDNVFELVAGERRLRAMKMLGYTDAPCIISDISDRNSAVLSLVENIQRKSLNYFDEAVAIQNLIDNYGLTQEDVAIRLGKTQGTVANKIRLLKLTGEEKALLIQHGLTERHARALLKLKDPADRMNIIGLVIKQSLNVERTEQAIEAYIHKAVTAEREKSRCMLFKDVRLFMNTINKAVENMKSAGIKARTKKIEHEDCIEYRVMIPIENANPIGV